MRIELFNCPIDAISMEQTLQKIKEAIHQQKQIHHVVVNVAKLVQMQENEELRKSVVDCDIINADGQGVVWAARLMGKKIPERVTGIDLMQHLIELSGKEKFRIFFFGAEESIVRKVVDIVREKQGEEVVAGYRNGYYRTEEEEAIAMEIAQARPNILFVAMGSPKKENFLFTYKHILEEVNLIMGVGGSFDVMAGKVKRAPVWVQKIGFEWLFRLIQEPRRLFMRYFTTNLALSKLIIKEKFRQRHKKNPAKQAEKTLPIPEIK